MTSPRPAPGWFSTQTELRRTTEFAWAVWVLVHLVHALAAGSAVQHWWSYLVGLVVWLVGCVVAVRPLRGLVPRARESAEALVVAVVVPVASVLDLASLQAGDVGTYANWANGGSAVLLVALVLRRHGLLAVAAGSSMLVIEGVVASRSGDGLPLVISTAIFVPVPLWLLGAWAVRRHMHRAGVLAAELRGRRAAVATDQVLALRWGQLRGRHRADLEEQVLPMLRRVQALEPGEELSPAERARARDAAGHMRDALLARSLMTRDLRRSVHTARARGVQVLLHNALDDGPAVHSLRLVVGTLLESPGLELLSVRTFLDPGQATLVLRGDDTFAAEGREAVAAATGTGLAWWERTEVFDLDGDVMVQLSGPYVD